MNNPDEPPARQRGTIARIGICLLNILQPGLGLIRLARYRSGFAFIFLSAAVLAGALSVYAAERQITYASFIGILAVGLAAIVIGYLGSSILCWRWSAQVGLRHGHLWRWYGLLGLSLLLSALSSRSLDYMRSKYRNFYAPSSSMAPTLDTGDRFFGMMQGYRQISRGDVVLVRKGNTQYVKRVAAIPGDTIAMRDGAVVLNGRRVNLDALGKVNFNEGYGLVKAKRLREQFPGEAGTHQIFDLGDTPQDNTPEVKLANGQYFLLGDNRDNSLDSRFPPSENGLGVVDRKRIEGRVLFRYWRTGIGLGQGQM